MCLRQLADALRVRPDGCYFRINSRDPYLRHSFAQPADPYVPSCPAIWSSEVRRVNGRDHLRNSHSGPAAVDALRDSCSGVDPAVNQRLSELLPLPPGEAGNSRLHEAGIAKGPHVKLLKAIDDRNAGSSN